MKILKTLPLFLFVFSLMAAENNCEVHYKLAPGLQPIRINVAKMGFKACQKKDSLSLMIALIINKNDPQILYDNKPLLHHTRDASCTKRLLDCKADIATLGKRTEDSAELNALEYHIENLFFAHLDTDQNNARHTINEEDSVIASLAPYYTQEYRESLCKKWNKILASYERNKLLPKDYSRLWLSTSIQTLLLSDPISNTSIELVDSNEFEL